MAKVEIFLLARDGRAGIRSVAAAAADARNTSLETGGEEQALERHPVCGFRDRGPFGWLGEDRVDDDGISGGGHAPRLFRKQGVNTGCRLDGVTPVWQPIGFSDPE